MIGIDGAAWPLVEGWSEAGHLPSLAAMIDGGTRGRLRTPDGFNDNAVWASFSTARRPERHGWLHYHRVRPGAYDSERVHRDSIDGVPFWQTLSDQGRTVTVVDVPKAPRGRGLRGVELVDWLPHGPDSTVPLSDPPELADQVVAAPGPAHPDECLRNGRTGDELAHWLDERVAMVTRQGDLFVEQLEARAADLFLGVFGASHCVGHQCWHLHDPGHPDHDPAMAARLGDPLLRIYQAIDREIGRMADHAPEDATFVVFACLGMGPNYGAGGAIDEILAALDPVGTAATSKVETGLRQAWRRRVPLSVRRAMPTKWHRAAKRNEGAQRRRRTWFPIDTGARSSGIRINLAGRERAGIVAPGAEYEATVDLLERELTALVDADTGARLVRGIEPTAAVHEGPYAANLPDLFVHWEPAPGPARAIRSERVGVIEQGPPDRTGHHHAHGFFVASGPGVAADRIADDARVVDLAPTVAARLGTELADVDGQVIPALAPAGRRGALARGAGAP